jgi:predicted flavoprotein YhiN
MPIARLTPDALIRLAGTISDLRLPVTGTRGFAYAQVTAGGIATEDFDPETLESRLCPGLYAAGEVLDVDGDCGGFNLMFAFASGLAAGGAL